jgi:ankyrin repeat protein
MRVFGHFLTWRDDPNLRDGSGRDMVMHTLIANHPRGPVFLAIDATDEDLNRRDAHGHSAVSYAAMHNHHFRVWDVLVEHGADLSKTYTKDLHTPLHLAARDNMAEVALAILRHGADINARDVHGNTPMMLALLQNKDGLMVQYLLRNGADATTRNDLGASVFHAASFGGQNASVFEQLVDAGAETAEPTDSALPTPAMMFAQYGQDPGVWAIFAEQGMSMQPNDEQGSPLVMSALTHKKDIEFIRAMLDAGCDVNAVYTPFNTTALMMACKDGSAELVELLLDHGADATIVDVAGNTALDSALKNPRLEGSGVVERVRLLVEG